MVGFATSRALGLAIVTGVFDRCMKLMEGISSLWRTEVMFVLIAAIFWDDFEWRGGVFLWSEDRVYVHTEWSRLLLLGCDAVCSRLQPGRL